MTIQESDGKTQQADATEEGGLNLIDLLTAMGEEKWVIGGIAFVCTLVGLVASLFMTNIYTAKTTFLPPQQTQSSAANALAQLGGLAGLAGGALGLKSPDEMYVGFLQSVTLQNNLIERYKLLNLYEQKTLSGARKVLNENVKIAANKKTGIISIEVDDKSPAFAAQLANSYVEELRRIMERFAVTDAQQRRVFFEKLIAKTKDALTEAELKSKSAQETSGIISLEGQAISAIKASADLRAQIGLREVQIQAMGSYATAQNPDMQRLMAELSGLRAQLDRLERGSNHISGAGKSGVALANLRTFREVKYQEALLDTLTKQFELARVEEAKEGPLIQQLDVAMPPERKSKPSRAAVTILAAMVGLMLGLLVAFARRKLQGMTSDPAMADSLRAMRQAWSFRKTKKAV